MKTLKNTLLFILVIMTLPFIASCSDDDKIPSDAEHDGTLFGEWVASDGKYIHAYYYFYNDGTGISGTYESDIDLINEDDDIIWYTENNEYIYINGLKCAYSCDGSVLRLNRNGKTKVFYPL